MNLNQILKIRNPVEFINRLAIFVFNPNSTVVNEKRLQAASPSIKAVIHLYAFDQSVTNSGIMGWFLDVYDEHPDIWNSFQLIEAKQCQDYFQSALQLFPRSKVPSPISKRLNICDTKENAFDSLDRKYSQATIAGIEALRTYIRRHASAFEAEVCKFWALDPPSIDGD